MRKLHPNVVAFSIRQKFNEVNRIKEPVKASPDNEVVIDPLFNYTEYPVDFDVAPDKLKAIAQRSFQNHIKQRQVSSIDIFIKEEKEKFEHYLTYFNNTFQGQNIKYYNLINEYLKVIPQVKPEKQKAEKKEPQFLINIWNPERINDYETIIESLKKDFISEYTEGGKVKFRWDKKPEKYRQKYLVAFIRTLHGNNFIQQDILGNASLCGRIMERTFNIPIGKDTFRQSYHVTKSQYAPFRILYTWQSQSPL